MADDTAGVTLVRTIEREVKLLLLRYDDPELMRERDALGQALKIVVDARHTATSTTAEGCTAPGCVLVRRLRAALALDHGADQ